jgi:hypothetical protein
LLLSPVTPDNENILSVVNLSDIVRHLGFGINKRVTAKKERDYSDDDLYQISIIFFDLMLENMNVLKQIQDDVVNPRWLRENSLLGSGTIWRCLAGAYNDLAVKDDNRVLIWNKAGHDSFVNMVAELHKKMKITTDANGKKTIISNWEKTDCFNPGETAPRSRAQDLRNLSALFTEWANSGKPFEPATFKK